MKWESSAGPGRQSHSRWTKRRLALQSGRKRLLLKAQPSMGHPGYSSASRAECGLGVQ